MPGEDLHLPVHARSQAHWRGPFQGRDRGLKGLRYNPASTSFGTAERPNRVEENVAEVRRFLRADSIHFAKLIDGLRAAIDHVT